jgi:hypothetical protein
MTRRHNKIATKKRRQPAKPRNSATALRDIAGVALDLTIYTGLGQTVGTTSLNAPAQRNRAFFVSAIRRAGPLSQRTDEGTRQFFGIGARSIGRTKPGNRTNKASRFRAVVEPLRLPISMGGASFAMNWSNCHA